MHVAVVGAGTLGRVYGLKLVAGGEEVSFVVRPERTAETMPFVIEQINGAHARNILDRPERVATISPRAQVILVAVRFEQFAPAGAEADPRPNHGTLVDILRPSKGTPIVILTPILPKQKRALEDAIGRATYAAMPSITGY